MKNLAAMLSEEEPVDRRRQFRDAFWSRWPEEYRRAVVESFWDDPDVHDGEVVQDLARYLRFRPAFLRKAPFARRVEWLMRFSHARNGSGTAFVVAARAVFQRWRDLSEGFWSRCGVEHESGVPSDREHPLPATDQLREAVGWTKDSSMARPEAPRMSFATAASLTPASSRVLWMRFAWRVRSWITDFR